MSGKRKSKPENMPAEKKVAMFDIIIKGGNIIDGSGSKPFIGDIGIQKNKITAIAESIAEPARKIYDAKGKTVTPGFIDGHTHSELNLMYNRQQPHALYQGITSIVTGQCGLGFAPASEEGFQHSMDMNGGIFGDNRKYLPKWRTFEEYLELLGGAAVNAASNVSHNAIREYACRHKDCALKGKNLETALAETEKAMQSGATGLSVGLSYYPGGFSSTEELVELCRVVKKYDGLFCVHQRLNDGFIQRTPIEEVIKVVEETGVRLNMLHYRTGGFENYTSVFEPFLELEKRGMDIHYEFYPYLAGAGLVLALIPGWVQEGGYEAIMERLTSKQLRSRILAGMKERRPFFFAENQTAVLTITKDPYSRDLGKTLRQISEERNETEEETIISLLVENHLMAGFVGIESQTEDLKKKLNDDQYKLFTDDRYTVGSDTIPEGSICHPRTFGAFAKTIRVMRERKVPAEYIIKKLTSLPAKLYRIQNRGLLKEGYFADICIMDYEKVRDRADFEHPRRRAEGVETVLVNGLPVLEYGEITGILSGEKIKRG